ncbi:MAG TPA: DUF1127 domain-containing protein [Thermohalobaculum sp.]|nr:DUF1127 domain-containing protein [Thermohalobaculum sp.]
MTTFVATLTGFGARGLRMHLPLAQWIRVSRERRRLAGLSERQLNDIGIDAATAAQEAARPFWDLPRRG